MTDLREQTQAHTEVGGPVVGDCWRTAVACLVEVDRDDVPHFVEEHGDYWFSATVAWVEARFPGQTLTCYEPSFPVHQHPERVILSGKSPRGEWLHALIADGMTGEVVWDVHPDRGALLSHVDVMALTERKAVLA